MGALLFVKLKVRFIEQVAAGVNQEERRMVDWVGREGSHLIRRWHEPQSTTS